MPNLLISAYLFIYLFIIFFFLRVEILPFLFTIASVGGEVLGLNTYKMADGGDFFHLEDFVIKKV